MPANERILIVGPSWIGDMIIAQSLFKWLKARAPDCEIDVVAPPWSVPLLERMPEIRERIELHVGHGDLGLGQRYRLGMNLRKRHYTWSIVLPRTLKSALIPWFANVPKRTGYVGEMRYGILNDLHHLDEQRFPMMVQRYLALANAAHEPVPLTEVPEPKLRIDADNAQRKCRALGLDSSASKIALAPGAEYGPAKRWPLERFAELARRVTETGNQVWIMGSEKEYDLGEQIARRAEHEGIFNLCGTTTLLEVVDLLGRCRAVVSNDSGLMHMAAAVGCEVIALYGSSTPNYTPPLSRRSRIIYHALECSPCFRRECPLDHLNCLRGITLEEVVEQLP